MVRIVPFADDHRDAAAALLWARHARDRERLPQLPDLDLAAVRAALDAALARPHARGFAALDGDALVGYLAGDLNLAPIWGRSGWVRAAGFALAAGQSVELLRDLYAALGDLWIRWGVFSHVALVPAADPDTVHAWFSLSFGIQQVHGLKPLDAAEPAPLPEGVVARRTTTDDRETLRSLSDLIWPTLTQAPCWGIHLPESENPDGWAELVDDPDERVWLAFDGDSAVACQGWSPAENGGGSLHIPEKCVHLTIAGTRESHRGRGIAKALRQRGEAEARAEGYLWSETDWRSANLLADRVWPREGFVPVVWRLARRIDERIAWANGPLIGDDA